jgi:GDP-mannose 6-dehydrogenase
MRISIFGLGYVGCVSLGCLAKNGFPVIGVEVNDTKIDLINRGIPTIIENEIDDIVKTQHAEGLISATKDYRMAVLNSDISILCVGTPSTPQGHLNLEHIYQSARQVGEALRDKSQFHVVIIRSTVLPGTNAKVGEIIQEISGKQRNTDFAVVSNPEFLREGTAVKDYFNPPYTLIGSDNPQAIAIVREMYAKINGPIFEAPINVAEIIKYVNNSYHALKVTFANEVGNICKQMGIDSHKVMSLFCEDKQLNISPYYFKPGFAYGGSCLPKDLKALKTLAHDFYLDSPMLQSIE